MHPHVLNYNFQFISNGEVRVTQRPPSLSRQYSVPNPILARPILIVVRRPIDLDDQEAIDASEIENIASQRGLPSEVETLSPQGAQRHPQSCLGGCQRLSHRSRPGDDGHFA